VNHILLRPPPRSSPFVWVTWLTKLISGEHKCAWVLWFQLRYQIPKEPETPQLREWNERHAQLVAQRANELEEFGFNVQLESENWLEQYGRSGTKFSGKPDIAVVERDLLTYEDCKTGRRYEADHIQVLLYAQIARQTGVRKPIAGVVVYPDGVELVNMSRKYEVRDRFVDLMQRVSAEPAQVPDYSECRYCKARAYCPERIAVEPGDTEWAAPPFYEPW
jgi:PD-(D/E)XK nuclease superfamily